MRQYTHGQTQATSGFEVLGITFNSSCMSSGCWNIDIKYNLAPNAITVGDGARLHTYMRVRSLHPVSHLSINKTLSHPVFA